MFIARGRLPTKKFNDVIPQLTRLISDWRLKKNGIGDRKKNNGRINCNTICSYGSGGTKTLGSAPRLEPKGKINTSAYRIGAFMAFKKTKKKDDPVVTGDLVEGGRSWEGAAPVRP